MASRKRDTGRLPQRALLFLGACLVVAGLLWTVQRVALRHPMGLSVTHPDAGLPSIEIIYAGFDVRDYPGDAVMQKLKRESPYSFVGYYLESPNHPDASWMGRWRSAMAEMGWGVAILYVGQQRSELGRNPSAFTDGDGRAIARSAHAAQTGTARAISRPTPPGSSSYQLFPSAWTR